ncbi:MAG: Ig-like domain-containing protein [Nitrospira sp.]|nr:Ig-like domain-containing protein [Nitrospira sp.]
MTKSLSSHTFRQLTLLISIIFFHIYIVGCGQKSDLVTSPIGTPKVILLSLEDRTVNFSKDNLESPPTIFAVFNKDMDPTSVRNSITLRTGCNKGVRLQPGSPAYDTDTRTLSLIPDKLEPNQQYIVSISKSALDREGNPLDNNYTRRFSTGPFIDILPPVFEGVSAAITNSSTEATLQWSLAEDQIDKATPQENLEYIIYQSPSGPIGESCDIGDINIAAPVTVAADDVCTGSSCTYKVKGLDAASRYCFLVRARDRGCHISGTQRIVKGTTNPGGKLYAANLGINSLFVFDNAGQAERVAPRIIESDWTRLRRPIGAVISNHANGKTLYLANFNTSTIVAYDWDPLSGQIPSGDVAPSRIFEGVLASLNGPAGLTMANESLYVSNFNSGLITRFKNAKDIREITDPTVLDKFQIVSNPSENESFVGPIGIAVDVSRNILYVVYRDTNNIAIVDNISQKNQPQLFPDWKISGAGLANNLTKISRPAGLLLDGDMDRLYVVNRGKENDNGLDDSILVFDQVSIRTSPNRSPSWSIKSADINEPVMLSLTSYPFIDLSKTPPEIVTKKRLYVTSTASTSAFKPRVLAFDDIDSQLGSSQCPVNSTTQLPTCTLTPNLVISGDHTQFVNLSGVVAEGQGDGKDTVYVTNLASVNIFENITFPSTGTQRMDTKPNRMIAPSIYGPVGVMVDKNSEVLYLSSFYGDSIPVFEKINDTATTGNVHPVYRIFGKNTGLSGPIGIALVKGVGGDSDRLYVANLLANNILEFKLDQCTGIVDCDIPPLSATSFSEPNVKLLSPIGITVDTRQANDPMDDLLYVSYRDKLFNDNEGDSVIMFGRNSSGGLTPLRRIRSPNDALVGPAGLYLDPVRQELYIANRIADQVLVFNVGEQEFQMANACSTGSPQNCSLSPVRVIRHYPRSSNPFAPFIIELHGPNGVFLDDRSSPPKLYVSARGTDPSDLDADDGILVYNNAETVNGSVVPGRWISSSVGILNPAGIFLDPDR